VNTSGLNTDNWENNSFGLAFQFINKIIPNAGVPVNKITNLDYCKIGYKYIVLLAR
jgi:hypothetical protein